MRNPFDATGTIGSLPCEKNLNLILAERNEPRLIKNIVKLLTTTRARLKQIAHMPDPGAQEFFRTLLKQNVEQTLQDISGVPVRGVPVTDLVASHTMCCLHAYFAKSRSEEHESNS